MTLSILGIVTARGGSKGVPRKNIRLLAGKPLLQYTAEAALASERLTHTILTTDDEEIAEVGRRCGLDVPFMRPAALAEDKTPTLPVLQHAVSQLEAEGKRYDAICLLQPTNPLRQTETIDGCIDLMIQSQADSVVTMLPVPHEYNPHWVYIQDQDGRFQLSTGEAQPIPRRQSLPPAYHREGSVYVMRRDVLMEQNSLYGDTLLGYLLEPKMSVNIDTWEDWQIAEERLSEQ